MCTLQYLMNIVDNVDTVAEYNIALCYLSSEPKLPLDFIERHKDELNWKYITEYRRMPEWFIRKHLDKIDWSKVIFYQKPSKQFIIEMQMKGYL